MFELKQTCQEEAHAKADLSSNEGTRAEEKA
jgi:hypothetical protein